MKSTSSILLPWHIHISLATIFIDARPKLQHPIDPAAKGVGFVSGSSRLNPEVRRALLNCNKTKSFTDLSFLSASTLFLNSSMMELSGLISILFLFDMYPPMLEFLRARAFIILIVLDIQPYSPVTKQQGEFTIRSETITLDQVLSHTYAYTKFKIRSLEKKLFTKFVSGMSPSLLLQQKSHFLKKENVYGISQNPLVSRETKKKNAWSPPPPTSSTIR